MRYQAELRSVFFSASRLAFSCAPPLAPRERLSPHSNQVVYPRASYFSVGTDTSATSTSTLLCVLLAACQNRLHATVRVVILRVLAFSN